MENIKWYIGKILDNNDPQKLGRVKATLYEIDNPVEDIENLVWCYPDQTIQNIPEIGDIFWFKVDGKFLTKRFYSNKIERETYNSYSIFDTSLKSNINGFTGEYPNNKGFFTKSGNGIVFNSETGETCLLKANSYIFINSENEIEIKSGDAVLESMVLGETLKTLLETILDEIVKIQVPTGVGISGTPTNSAVFQTIKTTELPNILSLKNKNN